MQLLLSKATKIHKSVTRHGNKTAKIELSAVELKEFVSEDVIIEVYRKDETR